MPVLRIAHRCGTDHFPELTIQSAKHSLSSGADYIEADIRFTCDQEPVICHDEDLLSLFGDKRLVSEVTLSEFQNLCYLQGREYPSLSFMNFLDSEVHPILFHVKEGGDLLERIVYEIKKREMEDRVILGIMAIQDIDIVRTFSKKIDLLAFSKSIHDMDDFLQSDVRIIRLWESWVTPSIIDQIHSAQKKVWVMTGKTDGYKTGYTSIENFNKLLKMNVDGILYNEINTFKHL